MASMNWLGFSLSPQELPPQAVANEDESDQNAASRLGYEISDTGVCFDLSSNSGAHPLNIPHSFGIFEAFSRNANNNHLQDWNTIKGMGSNSSSEAEKCKSSSSELPMHWRSPKLQVQDKKNQLQQQQKEPKLENFLGRDDHHEQQQCGDNYMLQKPNSCLQAAAEFETSTMVGGGSTNNTLSSSSSNIGLSMIKTWLRNQTHSDNYNNNESASGGSGSGSGSSSAAANGSQTLSLSMSMSTGSQSSTPVLPLLKANVGGGDSSPSDNRQQLDASTGLDTQTQTGAINETLPRKSIDTFGQRTSIYRGVTRHRWTGRYEAHLWDNSCRREGQTRKGRQVYLGGYDKEEKAARAYDLAALKYWGTTTTTNFPISNYEKELEEMKHMTRQEYVASLRRKSSGFSRGASIYRGVTRHHQHGRWQARIGRVAGNKDLYLGTFSTQEEAAEAYDIAAIKFRGLNAVTNFDMSRYDVKSILESSTLPIGGAAKRLKDAEQGEEISTALDAQRTDDDTTSHLTDFRYGAVAASSTHDHHHHYHHGWPNTVAFQQQQPYNSSVTMHYPYGQRLWCKQEQDSDHAFQDIHQLQLGNTHNFFQSTNSGGLHHMMTSMDSAATSMDNNSPGVIYDATVGDNNGYNGGSGGYVIPVGTVIANDGNPNQRSGNGFADTEVFGSTDPYHATARNFYYHSQQSVLSTDVLVKANAYDQGSPCNTWVPTAVPTLAPRSSNLALCPGAPPFSLLQE